MAPLTELLKRMEADRKAQAGKKQCAHCLAWFAPEPIFGVFGAVQETCSAECLAKLREETR